MTMTSIRICSPTSRHGFGSRDWQAHDEGTDGVGSISEGDQGRCSIRATVLGMDLRANLVFPDHIPAVTDLEERIRRIWLHHRSQEVLLSSPCWLLALRSNSVVWRLIQSLRVTGFRRGELCFRHFRARRLFLSPSLMDVSVATVSDEQGLSPAACHSMQ